MFYTPLIKKAMQLCFMVHKQQVDKGNLPYVFHPFYIACQMDSEVEIVVALLHDVVEDSSYSFDDLIEMGFSTEIIEALKLLTRKQENYFEYITRIKTNSLATKIKIADLKHNSDINRLDNVTKQDLKRIEKYQKALDILIKEN